MEGHGNLDIKYLSNNVSDWLGNFLYHEGFPNEPEIQKGTLVLVDMIRFYTEEESRFFPEVVLTTNLDALVRPIPAFKKIEIGHGPLAGSTFKVALKRCAILATHGWIIFMEASGRQVSYGIMSAESSELSVSLRRQLVGDLQGEETPTPIAYIRALGSKAVELAGTKERLIISVSLSDYAVSLDVEIQSLVNYLSRDVDEAVREKTRTYFSKVIEEATTESHGCIVAVIPEDDETLHEFCRRFPDGAYLPAPSMWQRLSRRRGPMRAWRPTHRSGCMDLSSRA